MEPINSYLISPAHSEFGVGQFISNGGVIQFKATLLRDCFSNRLSKYFPRFSALSFSLSGQVLVWCKDRHDVDSGNRNGKAAHHKEPEIPGVSDVVSWPHRAKVVNFIVDGQYRQVREECPSLKGHEVRSVGSSAFWENANRRELKALVCDICLPLNDLSNCTLPLIDVTFSLNKHTLQRSSNWAHDRHSSYRVFSSKGRMNFISNKVQNVKPADMVGDYSRCFMIAPRVLRTNSRSEPFGVIYIFVVLGRKNSPKSEEALESSHKLKHELRACSSAACNGLIHRLTTQNQTANRPQ